MNPERERQVDELYQAALKRDSGQRAAFLDQACRDDEGLRREVEALLTQEDVVLAPGAQVGAYRIEATIGQGGMGVVYRALDTKLNRPVAVKFLSNEIADATARRRFQREAQMVSSLNHPHILTVHDAGESRGRQYLVTEFVDGGTLMDWARGEKRTWRQVIELVVGVADGLAAAHQASILHRDIKPANILVAKNGYAKLADFGLAKLEERIGPTEPTQTLTKNLTRPGMIRGTIPYMSPEQALGRPLDARSDIFSFGVVLYELLAGKRPFTGVSDLEVLQTIINGTVPPLGADLPAGLRIAVEKALEKDPAGRYQSMREMVVDLRRLMRQSGEAAASAVPRQRRSWKTGAFAAAVLPVLLVTGFFVWRAWRASERTEPLRAGALTTFPGVELYPSLSPDGNYVAYTWTGPKQDNPDVYVQMIGSSSPLRRTTDSHGDLNPVWSPDGRWIAFLRVQSSGLLPQVGTSELRLISPLGGPERKVAEIQLRHPYVPAPCLAWCPDSQCLVVTDSLGEGKPEALFVVSLETGQRRPLTSPHTPVLSDSNPAISPDGRSLVFRREFAVEAGELYWLPLGEGVTVGGEAKPLASLNAYHPTWMPDRKEILFSAKGSLWRMVMSGRNPGGSPPARLPYVGEDGLMPVVSRPQPGRPARMVYARSFSDWNIWRIETPAPGAPASSPPVVAISSTRVDNIAQFSPDGRRVVFQSTRSGDSEIWLADPDGSNANQLTFMGQSLAPRWSPDGRLIVFESNVEGRFGIYVISAEGGKPRRLTTHPANYAAGSFSRDGQWIYFSSDRTGEYQIWKMPAAGGEAVQVTRNGGFVALESLDGAYVYYTASMGTKPSSLWRLPTSGGQPVKVLDGVVMRAFVVLEKGIYYIDRPSAEAWLRFLDFNTGQSKTVARNLGDVRWGLTASSDGRTILYSRVDSSVDDLMLVENFR